MSGLTDTTRRLVRERAQGLCELCLSPGTDPHHRQVTGMGGGGDHGAANLLLLCRLHHNGVHERPQFARERGWLVSRWSDPRKALVLVAAAGWVFLDDEGKYLREAAA